MPIDTSAPVPVLPLEDDEFEQFKRSESDRLKPAPVQQAAEEKAPSDSGKSEEPAGEPEAPTKTASEEKPKPTRKRDAESTIAEKTRLIKEREEELDRVKRQHAEEVANLRKELAQPKREAPTQETRPEAAQPEAGLMKRSVFREKYTAAHPEANWNDIDDAYDDYRDQYRDAERRATETRTRLQAKEVESVQAHPDYWTVCSADAVNRLVKTLAEPAVIAIRDGTDNPPEILYSLLTKPEELMRIARLSPIIQVREIYKLSASLGKPAEAPPAEAAKPPITPQMPTRVTPITRVTPPQRYVLSGGGASPTEGPDPTDSSFENWSAAEKRRLGKRA